MTFSQVHGGETGVAESRLNNVSKLSHTIRKFDRFELKYVVPIKSALERVANRWGEILGKGKRDQGAAAGREPESARAERAWFLVRSQTGMKKASPSEASLQTA